MKLTKTLAWKCGHETERDCDYDGRSTADRARAEKYLDFVAADVAAKNICDQCADEKSARAKARLAATLKRLATVLSGTISHSPKSLDSHYVTGADRAVRISRHPWPGRRESLISERRTRTGRYVAHLAPDWLAREKQSA